MATKTRYVLYVNDSKHAPGTLDRGSQMCVDAIGDDGRVHLQHVAKLTGELPAWLNGTPILVDRDTSQAFRGTSAVNAARSIATQPAQAASAAGAPPVARDRAGMPPPASSRGDAATGGVDLEGVLPPGEAHHHEDDGGLESSFQSLSSGQFVERPKVTENMLEEYMKQRGGPEPSVPT